MDHRVRKYLQGIFLNAEKRIVNVRFTNTMR